MFECIVKTDAVHGLVDLILLLVLFSSLSIPHLAKPILNISFSSAKPEPFYPRIFNTFQHV